MRIFMIDLENVRSSGLEGVLSLDKNDTVFIFYSDNAYNLTIPTLESINNSKATVKYIKTNYLGANAMDFQIVSLYGAMIERYKNGYFYIISHDHGFRSAVSFCQSYFENYGIRVGVYDNILAAITDELKELAAKNTQKDQAGSSNVSAETKKSGKRSRSKKKKTEQNAENNEQKAPESAVEAGSQDIVNNYSTKSNNVAEKAEKAAKTAVSGDVKDSPEQADGDEDADQQNLGDAAQTTAGEPKKKRRRRRKSNKQAAGDQTDASAEDAAAADMKQDIKDASEAEKPAQNNKPKQQKSPKPQQNSAIGGGQQKDDYKYIYKLLGELLSEKTIDVYAEGIHKAVLHSSNKDELHSYFKKKFGEDEGEALYRVVQSDFEEMKKLAR